MDTEANVQKNESVINLYERKLHKQDLVLKENAQTMSGQQIEIEAQKKEINLQKQEIQLLKKANDEFRVNSEACQKKVQDTEIQLSSAKSAYLKIKEEHKIYQKDKEGEVIRLQIQQGQLLEKNSGQALEMAALKKQIEQLKCEQQNLYKQIGVLISEKVQTRSLVQRLDSEKRETSSTQKLQLQNQSSEKDVLLWQSQERQIIIDRLQKELSALRFQYLRDVKAQSDASSIAQKQLSKQVAFNNQQSLEIQLLNSQIQELRNEQAEQAQDYSQQIQKLQSEVSLRDQQIALKEAEDRKLQKMIDEQKDSFENQFLPYRIPTENAVIEQLQNQIVELRSKCEQATASSEQYKKQLDLIQQELNEKLPKLTQQANASKKIAKDMTELKQQMETQLSLNQLLQSDCCQLQSKANFLESANLQLCNENCGLLKSVTIHQEINSSLKNTLRQYNQFADLSKLDEDRFQIPPDQLNAIELVGRYRLDIQNLQRQVSDCESRLLQQEQMASAQLKQSETQRATLVKQFEDEIARLKLQNEVQADIIRGNFEKACAKPANSSGSMELYHRLQQSHQIIDNIQQQLAESKLACSRSQQDSAIYASEIEILKVQIDLKEQLISRMQGLFLAKTNFDASTQSIVGDLTNTCQKKDVIISQLEEAKKVSDQKAAYLSRQIQILDESVAHASVEKQRLIQMYADIQTCLGSIMQFFSDSLQQIKDQLELKEQENLAITKENCLIKYQNQEYETRNLLWRENFAVFASTLQQQLRTYKKLYSDLKKMYDQNQDHESFSQQLQLAAGAQRQIPLLEQNQENSSLSSLQETKYAMEVLRQEYEARIKKLDELLDATVSEYKALMTKYQSSQKMIDESSRDFNKQLVQDTQQFRNQLEMMESKYLELIKKQEQTISENQKQICELQQRLFEMTTKLNKTTDELMYQKQITGSSKEIEETLARELKKQSSLQPQSHSQKNDSQLLFQNIVYEQKIKLYQDEILELQDLNKKLIEQLQTNIEPNKPSQREMEMDEVVPNMILENQAFQEQFAKMSEFDKDALKAKITSLEKANQDLEERISSQQIVIKKYFDDINQYQSELLSLQKVQSQQVSQQMTDLEKKHQTEKQSINSSTCIIQQLSASDITAVIKLINEDQLFAQLDKLIKTLETRHQTGQ